MTKHQQQSNIFDQADRSHKEYLGESIEIDRSSLQFGHVVEFVYDGKLRLVFVLNPEHDQMLHGISLNVMDRQTLLNQVISNYKLYRSPEDFYDRVMKKDEITSVDAYRTYKINKITKLRKRKYDMGKFDTVSAEHISDEITKYFNYL